jgi:hypothetical protein
VRRYLIKHDRDPCTYPGFHWNLFEIDTENPKSDPVFVGFGSYETCLTYAIGAVELRHKTGLRP